MQRVVWTAPRVAAVEEQEIGKPEAGEARIATVCSLVSPGTERAWLTGASGTPNRFPMYPGYSSVGHVEAVGPGVEALRPGDLVFAVVPHASGSIAPIERLTPVPAGLEPGHAAFGYLSSIALQGVRKARVELGERVAVTGAGLVGLLAMLWARSAGAREVVAIDPDPERRALALGLGADRALDAGEALPGPAPQVVMEASGVPPALGQALAVAAVRGRVVLLGSTRGVAQLDVYDLIHKKGATLIGAHTSIRAETESTAAYWTRADDQETALAFLASGRTPVAGIPVERYGPDRIGRLYRELLDGGAGLRVPLIEWPVPAP